MDVSLYGPDSPIPRKRQSPYDAFEATENTYNSFETCNNAYDALETHKYASGAGTFRCTHMIH